MQTKIIVSPSYQIARYWKQLGKLPLTGRIVVADYQLRGCSRNPDDYIFIHGEDFGYPYITNNFNDCLELLSSMFIGYKNISDFNRIKFVKIHNPS